MRRRDDRGSAAVEMAILAPGAMLLLALLAAGFRVSSATLRMSGVASQASRDASLERTAAAARATAQTRGLAALTSANLNCMSGTARVVVDTSGFSAPPGTNATITVDVFCTVRLAEVGVRGMPGVRTLRDSAVSPIDQIRGPS